MTLQQVLFHYCWSSQKRGPRAISFSVCLRVERLKLMSTRSSQHSEPYTASNNTTIINKGECGSSSDFRESHHSFGKAQNGQSDVRGGAEQLEQCRGTTVNELIRNKQQSCMSRVDEQEDSMRASSRSECPLIESLNLDPSNELSRKDKSKYAQQHIYQGSGFSPS